MRLQPWRPSPELRNPRERNHPRVVFLFRRDGRWQFGIAMTRGNVVQAMLIDADRSVDGAQRDVLRELAMSYGV